MDKFRCEICNFKTNLKNNYHRHLNTKKHNSRKLELKGLTCKKISISAMSQNEPAMSQNEPAMSQNEPAMSQNEPAKKKEYSCQYCGELFSTNPIKRRHEKYRCKKNEESLVKIINDKDKQILQMQAEKQELYKKMDKLLDKVGNTTNITNTITLNNYGNEDVSHITDTFKTHLLKIPYSMIPKMIEAVHFNDKKPENKNIMIVNKKENLLKVYKNKKWVYKTKNDTINDLVDGKYMMLDNHYDLVESKQIIEPNTKTNYLKFRKFYEEDDKEMVENLKKECELVLLNNR